MLTISSFRQFIGNHAQITKLKEFVKKKETQNIIILGAPGTGKTTVVNLLSKELNSNTLFVNKDNFDCLYAFINNNTITSFFDKRQKLIIFDDIDVTMQTDKVTCAQLMKIIKSSPYPVILTCNINNEKKILDLKKNLSVIKLQTPIPKDTFSYLVGILNKANIEYDIERLLTITKTQQGNVRESFLQCLHGQNEEISEYRNVNVFETIRKLLVEPLSSSDTSYLTNEDANVLSCMYYENIPEEIYFNRTKVMMEAIDAYAYITSVFIDSTILEDYMFRNFEWNLWDLVYYIRFMSTNMKLNEFQRKFEKDTQIKFSQILSKISHRNIMNKRIKESCTNINAENRLLLFDLVHHQTNEQQKKNICNSDEMNFLNTYSKYFNS